MRITNVIDLKNGKFWYPQNALNLPICAHLDLRYTCSNYPQLRHGPFDIRGGLGFFRKKNFLALILAKKIILLNGNVKKINPSQIITLNSLIGMFEMSKSKKLSGSLRSRVEYQI